MLQPVFFIEIPAGMRVSVDPTRGDGQAAEIDIGLVSGRAHVRNAAALHCDLLIAEHPPLPIDQRRCLNNDGLRNGGPRAQKQN